MNNINNPIHEYKQIRYANCLEDSDILLEGLAPEKNSNILSVGSAGDNSFSLLTSAPNILTVVDANIHQIYLIELKMTAFKYLEYNDLLQFLGFVECKNRFSIFSKMKHNLSNECRAYWQKFDDKIEKGIIHSGKMENYFRIYRKWILPFLANKKIVNRFFESALSDDQRLVYNKKLDNKLLRLIFKAYFNRKIMAKLGRSKEHFKHVQQNVSDYFFSKTRSYILSKDAYLNGYIRYITTGSFDKLLPHYIRKENYQIIKNNLDKLVLKKGFIQDVINEMEYNYFNLSNMFEYLNNYDFKELAEKIINNTNPGAKFVYWNLFVERKISDIYTSNVEFEKDLSDNLTSRDKLFYYKKIIVEKRV